MSREKKAQAGCYLEGHQSARVGLTDQGGGEANAAPKQMSAEGPHVLTVAQVRLAAAKLDKMLEDKQISYGSTIPAPSTADHGGTKHWSVCKAAHEAGLGRLAPPKYAFYRAFYGPSRPDVRAALESYLKLVMLRTGTKKTFTKDMHDKMRTISS